MKREPIVIDLQYPFPLELKQNCLHLSHEVMRRVREEGTLQHTVIFRHLEFDLVCRVKVARVDNR